MFKVRCVLGLIIYYQIMQLALSQTTQSKVKEIVEKDVKLFRRLTRHTNFLHENKIVELQPILQMDTLLSRTKKEKGEIKVVQRNTTILMIRIKILQGTRWLDLNDKIFILSPAIRLPQRELAKHFEIMFPIIPKIIVFLRNKENSFLFHLNGHANLYSDYSFQIKVNEENGKKLSKELVAALKSAKPQTM